MLRYGINDIRLLYENDNGHQLSPQELQTWLAELAELRARLATGKTGLTAEQLVAEDREDRV